MLKAIPLEQLNTFSETENKIVNLIYSGLPENDLLAWELVQHIEWTGQLFPSLLCVATTTRNELVWQNYSQLLLDNLPQDVFNDFATARQDIATHPQLNFFTEYFDYLTVREAAYINFKRDEKTDTDFLLIDKFEKENKSNHPKRKEVFEHYIRRKDSYYERYTFYGLCPVDVEVLNEMPEAFLESKFGKVDGLAFIMLQTEILPDFFRDKYLEFIEVRNTNYTDFPNFVFQIEGIKRLFLNNVKLGTIPEDWSQLEYLHRLAFVSNDFVFDNFDFLDTLPNLKVLKIEGNSVLSPSVLIGKKAKVLRGDYHFNFVNNGRGFNAPYQNNKPLDLTSFAPWRRGDKERKAMGGKRKKMFEFLLAVNDSDLEESEKKKCVDYFFDIPEMKEGDWEKNLPAFDPFILLACMNVIAGGFKDIWKSQVEKVSVKQQSAQSLNTDSVVYILGKTKENRKFIRRELKELGIEVTQTISDRISHVLVGLFPKDYLLLKDLEFKVLSEKCLWDL